MGSGGEDGEGAGEGGIILVELHIQHKCCSIVIHLSSELMRVHLP